MNFVIKKHSKISKLFNPIVIVFALILIASTYSLLRDLSTSGLRPFGVINDIFAQVTGTATINQTTTAALSGDYQIIDSWGRCLVDNPNAKKKIQTVAESGYSTGLDITSKAGLNQGLPLSSSDWGTEMDFMKAANINMSYIEMLAISPGDSGIASTFVQEANAEGKFPVIRLCYVGGCKFSGGANDIVKFYTDLENELAGKDVVYVGVVGPNEPNTGTPTEMSGFGLADNDYAAAVDMSNNAAKRLQFARAENGGHMYIAPVIFNMPNGVDIPEYLFSTTHATINPELYDFLMGNTYNIADGSAVNWYETYGMKKYVEDHSELLTLISEFGYSAGTLAQFKQSYQTLCNDDTVDGILFYRPDNPELPAGEPGNRQDPPINSKVLNQIISTCSKEPQKLKSKNSAWLNCNFDSCISKDYTYSSRSIAHPVTPVIVTSSGAPNSKAPASCNPNAYSVYNSQNVLNIGASNKDQSKIILIGDSETFNDPLPNSINIGAPGASTYWFLGNDPIDPNNSSKTKAKKDFENSLNLNAFAAIIMLGTNDCGGVDITKFKENLTSIAKQYAQAGIIPILSTFPERDVGTATAHKLPGCENTTDTFNSAIKSIASTNGWPLRDGTQMVEISDLGDDGLHISDYSCLDSGTNELLNKLRAILGGAPFKDGSYEADYTSAPSQDSNQKAWLTIKCSGDGCTAKQINTIQTWLPIKSLGSTTATNSTKYRSDTPSCVELATQVHSDQYDLLNQFAGKLSSGSSTYPMPWLGSLINCLSEMADYTQDFAGQPQVQQDFNPHPFSKKSEADIETKSDIARGLAKSPINSESVDKIYAELENTTIEIPDERSICLKDNKTGVENCYDSSSAEVLKLFKAYDAFSVPANYYDLDYKNSLGTLSNMIYLQNKDDMLPGPEINVGSDSTNFSAGDLCRRYGIRKIDDETKNNYRFTENLNCTLNPQALFDSNQIIYCSSVLSNFTLQSDAFKNGELSYFTDSRYANCLTYNPSSKDRIEYATQNYANAPSYNIEGAYDALYKLYLRLENEMSAGNKKVVFQKDIGWTAEVDSIIRDGNQPVDLGDYLYKGEYNTSQCVSVDFFDNKTAKARGGSVKKSTSYYEELGALEPMQEWIDVYTKGTSVPDVQEGFVTSVSSAITTDQQLSQGVTNPFYDPADVTKPNNDKKSILVSGLASQFLNFPLLTCDQVRVGENYSNEELFNALRSMDRYKSLSDDQVQQLADQVWPLKNKVEKGSIPACIALSNDNEIQDTMAQFLCNQGYSIPGVCNANSELNKCIYKDDEITSSQYTCPVTSNGNTAICIEGPLVGTHASSHLNALDLAGDTLVAPFDGVVAKAVTAYPYCIGGGTAGGAVFYTGMFQGQKTTLFFYHIKVTSGLQGKTFKKGEVIANTVTASDPSVTSTSCLGSPQHSHIEISNDKFQTNQPGDIRSIIYGMGCKQGSASSCQLQSDSTLQCDSEQLPPNIIPGGKCNEFNCGLGTNNDFASSLQCITSLGYLRGDTDKAVDIYGPFCDNETYKSGVLPFGHNLMQFYDSYLKPGTTGGRVCSELPPDQARPEDIGMACPTFSIRYGTEAYNYYRGALIRCPIPEDQRGWTSANSFGRDPVDLADYLMNTLNVNYNGLYLKNTPKSKVVAVLTQAKQQNINPFIILGIWGTESWFGQFSAQCNSTS